MLTVEEIKQKLEDRNVQVVARKTGIHFNTIHRLQHGSTRPSYATLERLSEYLEAKA